MKAQPTFVFGMNKTISLTAVLVISATIAYGETPPLDDEEAMGIVVQAFSEFGSCPTSLLEIVETNSSTIVVGFRADTNCLIRPPIPDAPYCFRVWVDRNTREILPSPMATSPGLTMSNVVEIVRNEDPVFSYDTDAPIAITNLSETTIARFPEKKPPSPGPEYRWLGADFACIVWIDNATSNILFWLDGK